MTKQEYLLIVLSEEFSEVQQELAKALRFGLDEGNEHPLTNRQRVVKELNDVIAMLEMTGLSDEKLLGDIQAIKDKKQKVREYINYSIELGIIHD